MKMGRESGSTQQALDLPARNLIRVADEVWIALALLHQEHPERDDFTVQEIVQRLSEENITGSQRPGVGAHAYLHCVANKAPNPTGYRMLYGTGRNTRRLYRPGDLAHPKRAGKTVPRRDQIPRRYHDLLDWYETEYSKRAEAVGAPPDPILALRGVGREIWQDEDSDEYVRNLREGWR